MSYVMFDDTQQFRKRCMYLVCIKVWHLIVNVIARLLSFTKSNNLIPLGIVEMCWSLGNISCLFKPHARLRNGLQR